MDAVPFVAEEITESHERKRPAESAEISKECERAVGEAGGAGDVGGEVTHTGDVIAENQGPAASSMEPLLDAPEAIGIDMQEAMPARDDVAAEAASD